MSGLLEGCEAAVSGLQDAFDNTLGDIKDAIDSFVDSSEATIHIPWKTPFVSSVP